MQVTDELTMGTRGTAHEQQENTDHRVELMNDVALKSGRRAGAWATLVWPANGWRLLILTLLGALALCGPEVRGIVFTAISDAYLQVTVFVAATLAIVYAFEAGFRFDLGRTMERARYFQAPIAAFLGALPGCGGAIVVMTQYTRGLVSFGSIVSVLIATMGDAAFLLIAREPKTGLAVMAMGFVLGSVSGWIVDAIHGSEFMRVEAQEPKPAAGAEPAPADTVPGDTWVAHAARRAWMLFVAPGAILGLFVAMQSPSDWLFGPFAALEPTHWFGVAGGVLCLLMWTAGKDGQAYVGQHGSDDAMLGLGARVIKDTNFVTSWVVLGFLTYELGTYMAGSGIESWLEVWAPFVPLVAVLVGFIPGCGPQIVVTTLYLAGAIPLSAQLGNSIANDGDALFPAIALAPKAAMLATLYSSVPAFIIAYSWFYLFE